MTQDHRLIKALQLIEENCDPGSRELLLLGHPALTAGDIGTLSRTSPEYQRHVLDRIRAGHARPLHKTAACALVYETVSFREVVSRMERALGGVRREQAFVRGQLDVGVPSLDRGPDRLLTLSLIVETADTIADAIGRLPSRKSGRVFNPPGGEADQDFPPNSSDKLHSASALGLLAKNARNVPLLKREHRPTGEERQRAMNLCAQISEVAQATLQAAWKKWGKLDLRQRVRPRVAVTRRVITHDEPDGDALVSAWLAERYLFAGEAVEILFVPRSRVLGCLRIGDCMVDVGNWSDSSRHLYDHKPPALPSRYDSCAAKLVWDRLVADGKPVRQLEELVLAVYAQDSVKHRKVFAQHLSESKQNSFHAALNTAKRRDLSDADIYRQMRGWLNKAYPRAASPRR